MIRLSTFALALTLLACSDGGEDSSVDGLFADGGPTAQPTGAGATPAPPQPAVTATTLPGAAPGPYEPNTQTDPRAASCGATKAAPFLGREATDAVRQDLTSTVAPVRAIRFQPPGSEESDDVRPNRLNVMLDAGNVIRDLRCG